MRILMAGHTFLPESRGGMENHVFHLAQYLLSRGHEVGVFYRIYDLEIKEYTLVEDKWEGLDIFRIVHNYVEHIPTPYPFYDRRVEEVFERVLTTYHPALLHMHHLADMSTSLPAASQRHGIPVILTLHDFWPMCFMSHLRTPDGILCTGPDEGMRCIECLWKRHQQIYKPINIRARCRELGLWRTFTHAPRFLLDMMLGYLTAGSAEIGNANLRSQMISLYARNTYMRKVLLTFNLLISPSRFLIQRFVEWGVPASRFRYVCNSVSASLRELRSVTSQREHVVFGFMGRLYSYKGAQVLIAAFKHLNSACAELRIWGDVPSTSSQEYVANLYRMAGDVGNIIFEGGFSPDQLPEVLRQIDVLVVPSTWYENNPLVILEAFAAGIPVIAGNIGGMAELVRHDQNGLQFRVGDSIDLAEKMSMMLEPGRLTRYRAAIEPPWSHEEMGAAVEDIYREVIESQ